MSNSNETLLNSRYRLIAQQGSGGMAVIYKAVDLSLGRTVAVKVLRPSLTNDRAFLDRFRDEARSVANLSHPNIVTVHDFGNDGPAHYIVMEFVEGQDLKQIIRTLGALPIDRALHMAIQICGGLGFAHRAGLVHADIKPQNILVTKEDIVKVTDFGIAQAFSDTHSGERQDVVWGSPHYFAPEQARGEKPTPASDVYAIGIVLFEMLSGRLPYTGTSQQELALAHIRDRVPLVTEFNPSVPDSLARIIEKTMSKEPNQRYRTADQLGHILASYRDRGRQDTMQNQPAASNPPPMSSPTQPRQPVVPPPPPAQQPLYNQPPAQQNYPGNNPNALPTQRYSVAPVAPATPQYGRQAAPANDPLYQPAAAPPQNNAPYYTPPPPQQSDSQFYTRPPYEGSDDAPMGLDVVTIALAVLAFMAVACLIPLYIAVLNAY